jgi:hypothetical protein
MPYTDGWDDALPAGGENANTIDDEIRKLKLSIHERMNELVDDWTADPVVPKNAIVGGVQNGKILLIPHTAMTGGIDGKPVYYSANYITGFNDLGHLILVPIILPKGVHLRTVSIVWDRGDNSQQYAQLRKHTVATGLSTLVELISHVDAGVVTDAFATIDYEIDGTEFFTVQIFGDGDDNGEAHRVHLVKVVYDAPDGAAVY